MFENVITNVFIFALFYELVLTETHSFVKLIEGLIYHNESQTKYY